MRPLPAVNFRQVKRALERLGFEEVRSAGSHFAFRKAGVGTVIVPYRSSGSIPKGTVRHILHRAHLTDQEFIAAL